MKVALERREWQLRRQHVAAHGVTAVRQILQLTVSDGAHIGRGEASPLPGYDIESVDSCAVALQRIAPSLGGADPDDPDTVIAEHGAALPSHARAALDCALRDLAARRAGVPLKSFLGAGETVVPGLSRLLGSTDSSELQREAALAAEQGYTAVKLKVDANLDEAIERVAAAAVPIDSGIVIADANGAFAAAGLEAALSELRSAGASVVEQPSLAPDWITSTPRVEGLIVSLDEESRPLEKLAPESPVGAVCLKLQRSGGIDRLAADAEAVRAHGMRVYLGSHLEGPVGIAAALHAAAAISPDLPSGLATLDSLAGTEAITWGKSPSGIPPEGAGLGVDWEGHAA